jgi:hypothetical protein
MMKAPGHDDAGRIATKMLAADWGQWGKSSSNSCAGTEDARKKVKGADADVPGDEEKVSRGRRKGRKISDREKVAWRDGIFYSARSGQVKAAGGQKSNVSFFA